MNYVIQAIGDKTIGWTVVVIAAAVFLYKCYKSVDGYFTNKARLDIQKKQQEEEQNRKLSQALDQIKQYPVWHQQSIDIRNELSKAIKDMGEKVDSVNESIKDLDKMIGESGATTSRYRILRFNDEILHEPEKRHTKEHFDQILEDIDTYEDYCDTHKDYKNSKAVAAIENIRRVYQKCTDEHTFL